MSRSSSSKDAMKVDFDNMTIEKKTITGRILEDCLQSRIKQESKVLAHQQ